MVRINVKYLIFKFKGIDALSALDILCWTLNQKDKTIYINGTRFALIDIYDWAEELYQMNACDVKLSFFGGPVSQYYHGNLFMLLLDSIIHTELKGDIHLVNRALQVMA